jgi:DNA repair protein RadC
MCSPETVSRDLRLKLGNLKNECFAVLYVNGRHEVLMFREHVHGTIDNATVFPE